MPQLLLCIFLVLACTVEFVIMDNKNKLQQLTRAASRFEERCNECLRDN